MKAFLLILSIMMPPNQPDIDHATRVESADACWAQARKWTETELSEDMKQMGAIGRKASCAVVPMPDSPEKKQNDDGSF